MNGNTPVPTGGPAAAGATAPAGAQGDKTNKDMMGEMTEGAKAAEAMPKPDFGRAPQPPGAGQGTGTPPHVVKAQMERLAEDIEFRCKRIETELDFLRGTKTIALQVAANIRISN